MGRLYGTACLFRSLMFTLLVAFEMSSRTRSAMRKKKVFCFNGQGKTRFGYIMFRMQDVCSSGALP